ncbi:MAG: DMT family transporter [Gammaproteobacteria bacterium]
MRDYGVALLLGVLLAAHWVTYFYAMQVSSVAVGVIALHTFPIVTAFIEALFHGERPKSRDVISALVVLVGVYLLVSFDPFGNAASQGVLWGVLSVVLFALRNIIQRRYFGHYPARRALFYQTLVALCVLLPWGGPALAQVTGGQWLQLLLLGVAFTALPHTLFAHGLLHLRAATASLIACLQVLYASLFAALLLGEWPGIATTAGGVVIVGAAMFESHAARAAPTLPPVDGAGTPQPADSRTSER